MRIRFALPLLAAATLAACSGSADEELADEALSADEVAGAATEADFPMPRAGQYSTTQELIEFQMPSLPAEQLAAARAAFATGAAEPHTYCVAEDMTREQWLSNMAESDCTVSRSTAGAEGIDIVMTCNGAQGVTGRVAMKGTASEDASDLEMTFSQTIPGAGDSTIRMRVKSERTGDCA